MELAGKRRKKCPINESDESADCVYDCDFTETYITIRVMIMIMIMIPLKPVQER